MRMPGQGRENTGSPMENSVTPFQGMLCDIFFAQASDTIDISEPTAVTIRTAFERYAAQSRWLRRGGPRPGLQVTSACNRPQKQISRLAKSHRTLCVDSPPSSHCHPSERGSKNLPARAPGPVMKPSHSCHSIHSRSFGCSAWFTRPSASMILKFFRCQNSPRPSEITTSVGH